MRKSNFFFNIQFQNAIDLTKVMKLVVYPIHSATELLKLLMNAS